MGTYVVLKPDGEVVRVPGGKKLELARLYELIGCRTVECTPVQYEGRKRDCWIDEEGLLKPYDEIQWNSRVRFYSQAYWAKHEVNPFDIQKFAGVGVIWMPRG